MQGWTIVGGRRGKEAESYGWSLLNFDIDMSYPGFVFIWAPWIRAQEFGEAGSVWLAESVRCT